MLNDPLMADTGLEKHPNDNDQFLCPICLEEIRKPKYLPCYHTFCESCIQTYISSTAVCSGDNSPKTIQCPVCRKSIQAPSNEASNEEWACSLPENKLILCMSVNSDNSQNKNCMFCQRNDKTVQAKHWCKTCTETICDDCKSIHSYVPMLKDHKIVRLSDVEDLRKETEIDEPCVIHKGKYVEVFCHDHDQLCCSTCFFTKHRFCKKVESMEDATIELEESYGQITPSCFIDVLKKLGQIQEEYRKTVINLNAKKQEICTNTDTKIEEIKSLLDKAHNQWMKQFEQKHSDAVRNIEIASDEVKRFVTAVQEAKTMMQRVLENGSKKQIFVSRYKVRRQILDHVDRLHNLKIWEAVTDYNQPDTDFLRQVCDDRSFQDVGVFEMPTETLETVSKLAAQLQNNPMLYRRKVMSQKDWMKIKFQKLSDSELNSNVYYGLFVDDNKVLLSAKNPPSLQIYDITDNKAKCVLTYPCTTTPFGLCQSGDSMDKVYVSFETHVDYYKVEISHNVTLRKIKTIELKTHMYMKALSCGPEMFFTRNDSMKMICTPDFSVKYISPLQFCGTPPFISASFHSDKHAVIVDNDLLVLDRNNEKLFKKNLQACSPRGLAFDLQENIFVCLKSNKLIQIKYGSGESRNIELPGIEELYNVVLHPTGEKMLVLDFCRRFSVYRVL
ncbi:E3 ubiquitin-protein ligase TRIM33-like [Magallana gigas]|uniref:E3 ubiquitin-protein ligase TRIM33-like n=1 Tax=Magallana gigas TaxID=29159 RepID=UPI00333ED480